MIARILLAFFSIFGIVIGLAFLAGGIFGNLNPDLVTRLASGFDLSSMPRAEPLKKKIVESIEEMKVMQTISWVLTTTGIVVFCMALLGLLSTIATWASLLIIYICLSALTMLGFFLCTMLVTGVGSVFDNTIVNRLAHEQETKFVSILPLIENNAGDATFVTMAFNLMQLKLGCCGIRTIADVRNSSRWQASPRALAGLLDVRPTDGGVPGSLKRLLRSVASDAISTLPDWLRDRIPPGATLPPGVNLPDKLPEGIVIPETFNISWDILSDAKAISKIRKLLEDSLVILTPVTCCRLNVTGSLPSFEAKALVSSMVDPNCPFKEANTGIYQETCYKKLSDMLKKYSVIVIMVGILTALLLSCNLCWAVQILIH